MFKKQKTKKKKKQTTRPLFLEGERGQQYFSFSTTTRFYDVEQKRNYSVLTSRSIAAKVRRSDRRSEATVGSRDFN